MGTSSHIPGPGESLIQIQAHPVLNDGDNFQGDGSFVSTSVTLYRMHLFWYRGTLFDTRYQGQKVIRIMLA